MKLTKFETFCLNTLCDDYENIALVQEQLCKDLNQSDITNKEVTKILQKLYQNGLVYSYIYDSQNLKFCPTSFDSNFSQKEFWFYISDLGRKVLDENWNLEWGD